MGAGFPVGVRLGSVGIAEREVYARHLLVLKQNADHVAETEVRAKRELAHPIAVGVGMAVVPEVTLKILAIAAGRRETPILDVEHERRVVQAPVPWR